MSIRLFDVVVVVHVPRGNVTSSPLVDNVIEEATPRKIVQFYAIDLVRKKIFMTPMWYVFDNII